MTVSVEIRTAPSLPRSELWIILLPVLAQLASVTTVLYSYIDSRTWLRVEYSMRVSSILISLKKIRRMNKTRKRLVHQVSTLMMAWRRPEKRVRSRVSWTRNPHPINQAQFYECPKNHDCWKTQVTQSARLNEIEILVQWASEQVRPGA